MRGLTPAAAIAIKDLQHVAFNATYEDAKKVKKVIRFIEERDSEVRDHRETKLARSEFEAECG